MKRFQHWFLLKRQSQFKNKTTDTLIFSEILSELMIKICAIFISLNERKESRFMSPSGRNKASIPDMFRFFFFSNINLILMKISCLEILNNTVLQCNYSNNGSNGIISLVIFEYQPVYVVIALLISGDYSSLWLMKSCWTDRMKLLPCFHRRNR